MNAQIKNAIIESIEEITESGKFEIEVSLNDGNLILIVSGNIKIEGYTEDNYCTGTGAFITTDCSIKIDSIDAYNAEGDEVNITLKKSDVFNS